MIRAHFVSNPNTKSSASAGCRVPGATNIEYLILLLRIQLFYEFEVKPIFCCYWYQKVEHGTWWFVGICIADGQKQTYLSHTPFGLRTLHSGPNWVNYTLARTMKVESIRLEHEIPFPIIIYYLLFIIYYLAYIGYWVHRTSGNIGIQNCLHVLESIWAICINKNEFETHNDASIIHGSTHAVRILIGMNDLWIIFNFRKEKWIISFIKFIYNLVRCAWLAKGFHFHSSTNLTLILSFRPRKT